MFNVLLVNGGDKVAMYLLTKYSYYLSRIRHMIQILRHGASYPITSYVLFELQHCFLSAVSVKRMEHRLA